ncbi:MAG: tetratricopeptide repeat protein [Planctomycetes bacterium]|nr:tetratricopeptide repeat protein [Planctomycetota bacterium]
MPSRGDQDLGELALKRNLISDTQLERALALLEEKTRRREPSSLGDVLVDQEYLSPDSLYLLEEILGRRIVLCPGCGVKMNVFRQRPGTALPCPRCREQVKVPERPISLAGLGRATMEIEVLERECATTDMAPAMTETTPAEDRLAAAEPLAAEPSPAETEVVPVALDELSPDETATVRRPALGDPRVAECLHSLRAAEASIELVQRTQKKKPADLWKILELADQALATDLPHGEEERRVQGAAFLLRARAQWVWGEWDRAIEDLGLAAASAAPVPPELLLWAAKYILSENRASTGCLAILTRFLERTAAGEMELPDPITFRTFLIRLADTDDRAEGEASYQFLRALAALFPMDGRVRFRLGLAAYGLKATDEAIEHLMAARERLAEIPGREAQSKVVMTLAEALYRAGRREEACEYMEQAIKIDPANTQARLQCGLLLWTEWVKPGFDLVGMNPELAARARKAQRYLRQAVDSLAGAEESSKLKKARQILAKLESLPRT